MNYDNLAKRKNCISILYENAEMEILVLLLPFQLDAGGVAERLV